MTPGRKRPLYAAGTLGVCSVTACASAGIACATAVAAAASAGNALIMWRRFMAVSLEIAIGSIGATIRRLDLVLVCGCVDVASPRIRVRSPDRAAMPDQNAGRPAP